STQNSENQFKQLYLPTQGSSSMISQMKIKVRKSNIFSNQYKIFYNQIIYLFFPTFLRATRNRRGYEPYRLLREPSSQAVWLAKRVHPGETCRDGYVHGGDTNSNSVLCSV
ncbi:hypothetical protein PanWU01x14_303680, partial [Parasponia andersonii]